MFALNIEWQFTNKPYLFHGAESFLRS